MQVPGVSLWGGVSPQIVVALSLWGWVPPQIVVGVGVGAGVDPLSPRWWVPLAVYTVLVYLQWHERHAQPVLERVVEEEEEEVVLQ